MSSDVQATLKERATTHGDYAAHNSRVAQLIKDAVRSGPNWGGLCSAHREALDSIATKLSRIVSGNAHEPDHWVDVAGYAGLGERACEPFRDEPTVVGRKRP